MRACERLGIPWCTREEFESDPGVRFTALAYALVRDQQDAKLAGLGMIGRR